MPITTGPRIPDPDTWTNKQIERTQAAGEAWVQGMLAPKKDPVAAARAAEGKWKNSMQKAINEGRFGKALAKVDSAVIAETVNNLGSGVFTNGVAARQNKIRAKVAAVHRELASHVQRMDALPTDTPEQREQKMLQNLRGMRAIGDRLKGVSS